ncbi:MAG: hypothetical protein U0936_15950 [Planctomycetaceae bacterium]
MKATSGLPLRGDAAGVDAAATVCVRLSLAPKAVKPKTDNAVDPRTIRRLTGTAAHHTGGSSALAGDLSELHADEQHAG